MSKLLDLEKDKEIDPANLHEEFRAFPSTLYSWLEAKASAEQEYDLSKAVYEEAKSLKYLELKESGEKLTENHLSARIEADEVIKKCLRNVFTAKRDLETFKNYVESLRAKKDMLIQLGSDRRKEL